MTYQTVDDLHEKGPRVRPDVIEAAREADISWGFEYEIPPETNGWVYAGDGGAAACSHNWFDRYPDPRVAMNVHRTPTHPRDETPELYEVRLVRDMGEKIDSAEVLWEREGEPYRTPLHVGRRVFWQAVEYAVEWMDENPPESV